MSSTPLDSNTIEIIVNKIQEMLGPGRPLLLLSLTGSRAFGWAGDDYDYDIHGIFCAQNWFDYVHYGGHIENIPIDLNLHSLDHVLYMAFYHPSAETLLNLTEPFWSAPGFYELFERYILANVNKLFFYEFTVQSELHRLTYNFHSRTALHAYRVLLYPIYWAKTGKLVKNIYRIIEELGLELKGPYECREAYQTGQKEKCREDVVRAELDRLYEEYKAVFTAKDPSTDWDGAGYRDWYARAEKTIIQFKSEIKC